MKESRPSKLGVYVLLHGILMLYSLSSICSKLAAGEPFLSLRFVLFYGASIVILGVYAIGWQQAIKHLPLTTAYANKAVTVVWGLVWGLLLFHEAISLPKLLGAALVLAGVVLYVTTPDEEQRVTADGGDTRMDAQRGADA